MALSTVDLPEPDSPTMPKVSPAATSNETLSTARISLPPTRKVTLRSSTVII
jgi:hypothetical protein